MAKRDDRGTVVRFEHFAYFEFFLLIGKWCMVNLSLVVIISFDALFRKCDALNDASWLLCKEGCCLNGYRLGGKLWVFLFLH